MVKPLGNGPALRLTPAHPGAALPVDGVEELLDRHGALFLQGYGAGADAAAAWARRFVRRALRTPFERVSHAIHRDLQTATKGTIAQDFHAEFSHLPHCVTRMVFWCDVPGNPNHIVDGARLVEALSADVRRTLSGTLLRFTALHTAAMWHAFTGVSDRESLETLARDIPGYSFTFLPEGGLLTHYLVPAIHPHPVAGPVLCNNMIPGAYSGLWVTHADGRPLADDVIRAVRDTAHALAAPIRWQAGDILVLDNTRVMHARDAQPAHRRLYLVQGWHEAGGDALPAGSNALNGNHGTSSVVVVR
ncbi:MAG: TauD/TfdA family dioxygenase [Deltaproteobacteria bacterium]|nr:TauD/TfdA family dioxygenase [Deltaproteobacteria bacterium]